MKGKSFQSNLLVFFQDVTKELDRGRAVVEVYLEFSKALDTVLLDKLVLKIKKAVESVEIFNNGYIIG